ELLERIEYMAAAGGDTLVDEQAMPFTAAGVVEADAAAGAHRGRNQSRAQRQLQVQQRIEAAPGKFGAQRPPSREAGFLVVDEQFDAVETVEQLRLAATGDPGDRSLRRTALQCPHQRHGMG